MADFDTPVPHSSDTVVEEGKTIAMIAYHHSRSCNSTGHE